MHGCRTASAYKACCQLGAAQAGRQAGRQAGHSQEPVALRDMAASSSAPSFDLKPEEGVHRQHEMAARAIPCGCTVHVMHTMEQSVSQQPAHLLSRSIISEASLKPNRPSRVMYLHVGRQGRAGSEGSKGGPQQATDRCTGR